MNENEDTRIRVSSPKHKNRPLDSRMATGPVWIKKKQSSSRCISPKLLKQVLKNFFPREKI